MTAEAALDDDDRFDLRIGRVARAHVHLDAALRSVQDALRWGSPPPARARTMTGGLIDEVRRELRRTAQAGEIRDAALEALSAARVANKGRNSIIHEMRVRIIEADRIPAPEWHALRAATDVRGASVGTRDLDSLDALRDSLVRARVRVQAIAWVVFELGPALTVGSRSSPNVADFVAMMQDRFQLMENGAILPIPLPSHP